LSWCAQFLNLVRSKIVLHACVVVFEHKVRVGPINEHQVLDELRSHTHSIRFVVTIWVLLSGRVLRESVDELRDQLVPGFGFALHQENDALSKDPKIYELLLLKLEVAGALKVVVCFVEILELDFDLCDLVQC
jgi:hypothetical protein